MNIELIKSNLDANIEIVELREHSKASEKYIDIRIYENKIVIWEGSIPYYYRRTGLFIESENELAEYLNIIKVNFTKKSINNFVKRECQRWQDEMLGKKTTKSFFDILLNMRWNSIREDLPNNPNWARRIQDIKEFGYTLATNTNMPIKDSKDKGTHILLVPLPKGGVNGYEVMSEVFKKKAIEALNSINSFEARKTTHGLIPDHKFPEIRWDSLTKESNENLTDDEIGIKFQLLDNQRNLQKREVCRKCFQTNKRGIIFGINYFYEGDENWSDEIPKIGKEAESGCIGCAWYDIEAWRDSLNKILLIKKEI